MSCSSRRGDEYAHAAFPRPVQAPPITETVPAAAAASLLSGGRLCGIIPRVAFGSDRSAAGCGAPGRRTDAWPRVALT